MNESSRVTKQVSLMNQEAVIIATAKSKLDREITAFDQNESIDVK